MIENREMAAFAKGLWENFIKFRNNEADMDKVGYYKAQVTAKPSNGVLTIKRPFDSTGYNVACPSYMDDISVGGQVLVLKFGNDNNLKNHFVIDNAARTMLASAIATGSSITFPISIANGGTNATTLAGAQANLGIPTASTATPNMDGTGSAGTATSFARGDHTHPSDTTKADVTATVSNVSYDSSSKKIQETINGTTTDVVTLAGVATSGSYSDLSNKPTIPSVTLNGSATTSPSFYAPTSAGTSGYVLTSNGSGAPTWQAASSGGSNVTLNGSASANPSFYAPLTGGTANMVLRANGNNSAPTWGWETAQIATNFFYLDDGSITSDLTYSEIVALINNGTYVYAVTDGDFPGRVLYPTFMDFEGEEKIIFTDLLEDATSQSIFSDVITMDSQDNITWETVIVAHANLYYATCSSQNTLALAAWTTANTDYAYRLDEGMRVAIKFTYAKPTQAQGALTLNLNGLGAKTIVCNGVAALAGQSVYTWDAGDTVEFLYDGTYWQMLHKYDAATTSAYGVTMLSSATDSTSQSLAATPYAVKQAYDLANSRSYAISMANNVITLTGQDGNTSSVTLPVWDGSYSAVNNS